MIQLTLLEGSVEVQEHPNGNKLLILDDPVSGMKIVVPLPPESAREIGAALSSGIVRASVLPLPADHTNGG